MANTSARTAPEIDASQPSQNDLMQRLANSLAGEKASATFACGGKILTTVERGSVAPDSPIVFYEDKNGQSHKITFPASPEEMEKLASDCDPASFGVGGEDVMDLDYRCRVQVYDTDIVGLRGNSITPSLQRTFIHRTAMSWMSLNSSCFAVLSNLK